MLSTPHWARNEMHSHDWKTRIEIDPQVILMQMDERNAISKPGMSELVNHNIDQGTIASQQG